MESIIDSIFGHAELAGQLHEPFAQDDSHGLADAGDWVPPFDGIAVALAV